MVKYLSYMHEALYSMPVLAEEEGRGEGGWRRRGSEGEGRRRGEGVGKSRRRSHRKNVGLEGNTNI